VPIFSHNQEIKMATAYLYFGKPVNPDTTTNLIMGTRTFMGEKDPQGQFLWDTFQIAYASGGGDVISAVGAYNELRRLSVTVHSHNAGACDSSVILPFMAGSYRTAAPASSFFFHQIQWSFSSQTGLQTILVKEANTLMDHYTDTIAKTVSAGSDLSEKDVKNMMLAGTLVLPKEAMKMKLIHAIAEPQLPQDARSYQV
jgi:ATP-dependent protease ClpP protease subunit